MSSVFGAYGRYLEFCSAFCPILVGHLLVPTMAAAYGREPMSVVSFPLSAAALEQHFVYSRDAVKNGRWWTALSYMLCHADFSHLASNAQGLLLSGPAALEALGWCGALATYAGAGVFGALDLLRIYDLQLERLVSSSWKAVRGQLEAVATALVPSGVDDRVLAMLRRKETKVVTDLALESWEYASKTVESATKVLDHAAARLATSIASDFAEARRLIGASAGVSAFLAVDACASLEKCVALLASPQETHFEAFTILLHALGAARYFAAEASRAFQGAAPGVDHAAHLNGAAFGLFAFALAKAYRFYRRRSRSAQRRQTHRADRPRMHS